MVKSLKDLVIEQSMTGEEDIEIVYRWFVENNKQLDGIKLMTELAESATNVLTNKLEYIKLWMSNLPDMVYYSDDKEIVAKLNLIQRLGILDYDLNNYTHVLNWAKENIPNMKEPAMFYQPVKTYLAKYDIRFKNDTKDI